MLFSKRVSSINNQGKWEIYQNTEWDPISSHHHQKKKGKHYTVLEIYAEK